MYARNWRNVRVDLRTVSTPALVGPFDHPFEAVRVVTGSATNLWLIDRPYEVATLPTIGWDALLDFGVELSANNLFLPAHFERWWLAAASNPSAPTILSLFWDLRVPVTR